MKKPTARLAILCHVALAVVCIAAPPAPKQGHSHQGESFNDGPRQAAKLLPGQGKVRFPVSSKTPLVREFVEQGVGQLHGFWYWEAERSFRQAAALDPDCAIAFWGMAQANVNNETRARGFIEKAVAKKAKASRHESLYIDAFAAFLKPGADKDRYKNLVRALEDIAHEFETDLEARAQIGVSWWLGAHKGLPVGSVEAADALLKQVFAAEPMHPAHHYVIHHWDNDGRAKRAIPSAARCGQSAPGIAHMWHMPAHTFSKLKRYEDSAWQLEASARVDHAAMLRDRVMPYEIHNYAHNNEWCSRDLAHSGRVERALAVACDLAVQPRHPRLNSATDGGKVAGMGRRRVLETCLEFELWDRLLEELNGGCLDEIDVPADRIARLRALGLAHLGKGDVSAAAQEIAALDGLLAKHDAVVKTEKDRAEADKKKAAEASKVSAKPAEKPVAKPESKSSPTPSAPPIQKPEPKPETKPVSKSEVKVDAKPTDKPSGKPDVKPVATPAAKPSGKPSNPGAAKPPANPDRLPDDVANRARSFRAELAALKLLADKKPAEALKEFEKAKDANRPTKARFFVSAGDLKKAAEVVDPWVKDSGSQALPLAHQVDVFVRAGKAKEAETAFSELRKIAGRADRDLPALKRLAPFAKSKNLPADWRQPAAPAADAGARPELASLGPLSFERWSAPAWSIADSSGVVRSQENARRTGRPTVILFYLGAGCVHCVEQLKAFAPLAAKFDAAGIDLLAISTEDSLALSKSLVVLGPNEKMPFPLAADPGLKTFKEFGVYDDFERIPLHGTFLVDPAGKVLWRDVRFEPFSDAAFLLKESERLLKLSRRPRHHVAAGG